MGSMKLTSNQKTLFAQLHFDRWTEILPRELPTLKRLSKKNIVRVGQSGDLTLGKLHPRLKPTKAQQRFLSNPLLKTDGFWYTRKEYRVAKALEAKGWVTIERNIPWRGFYYVTLAEEARSLYAALESAVPTHASE